MFKTFRFGFESFEFRICLSFVACSLLLNEDRSVPLYKFGLPHHGCADFPYEYIE